MKSRLLEPLTFLCVAWPLVAQGFTQFSLLWKVSYAPLGIVCGYVLSDGLRDALLTLLVHKPVLQ